MSVRSKLFFTSNNKQASIQHFDDLTQVSMIERYRDGVAYIDGKTYYFCDNSTFINDLNELIIDKKYNFITNSSVPFIIDCGANIGLSALSFKQMYPESELIAFEPDPKIFALLNKNLQSNSISNAEAINAAVWTCNTTIQFGQEGGHSGRIDFDDNPFPSIPVKGIDLYDYLDRRVDFLKIDIEGAEYAVIERCRDRLLNVKNIFIEYHSFYDQDQTLGKLLEILTDTGFRYQIKVARAAKEPFIEIDIQYGMDLQLEIYGYRP